MHVSYEMMELAAACTAALTETKVRGWEGSSEILQSCRAHVSISETLNSTRPWEVCYYCYLMQHNQNHQLLIGCPVSVVCDTPPAHTHTHTPEFKLSTTSSKRLDLSTLIVDFGSSAGRNWHQKHWRAGMHQRSVSTGLPLRTNEHHFSYTPVSIEATAPCRLPLLQEHFLMIQRFLPQSGFKCKI